MAKTEKTDAVKIATAWRHSVQPIDENNGARPPVITTKIPKVKSSRASRIGTKAGPGCRNVPSGRTRLSQITTTAKRASTVPESRSVVIVARILASAHRGCQRIFGISKRPERDRKSVV